MPITSPYRLHPAASVYPAAALGCAPIAHRFSVRPISGSAIEKSVRAEQWTLPGDPLRLDYSYRRNGTRGFVHTLSVTRAPGGL